jgi:hypothetical protein
MPIGKASNCYTMRFLEEAHNDKSGEAKKMGTSSETEHE